MNYLANEKAIEDNFAEKEVSNHHIHESCLLTFFKRILRKRDNFSIDDYNFEYYAKKDGEPNNIWVVELAF